MQQQSERHDDVKVPNIRRRPGRVSHEQWERYVECLFPKYSPVTHRLARIAPDSAFPQFDVIPVSTDGRDAPKRRVVIRGPQRGDNHCTCDAFQFGVYGTCPHVQFALAQLAETSNDLHGDPPERPYSEIFLRHGLKREIVFRPAVDVPRVVLKAARYCFDSNGLLAFDHFPYLKTLIERAADCRHELLIDGDVFGQIAFLSQQRERHRKIMTVFRRGVHSKAFDSLLTAPLAVYQREAAINAAVAGRFLLFDSPGLGRRRTALAAAEILIRTAHVRRVLVLTNTPTLHTWLAELQQSTPRKSQVVFGSPAKRSELYAAETQYTVARYDDLKDDLAAITGRMRPGLLILDETHTLKRHGPETARIVRRLESEYLFVLSGADPVRVPGPFVSFVDMLDRRRTGLLDDFLARHQQFDLRTNTVNYVDMGHVARTLPQHFRRFESAEYRRSLPALIEHDRFLPLTEPQATRHAGLQNRLFQLATPWRDAVAEYKKRALEKNAAVSTPEQPAKADDDSQNTPSPSQASPNVEKPAKPVSGVGDTTHEIRIPKPVVVPAGTLHEMQAIIAEMLNTANDLSLVDPACSSGCKIDTMFELLQEHLESPQVKAVVFAQDARLLHSAREKLANSPVSCGLIDRYTPPREQKDAAAKFLREPNCRVLFASDGIASRLVFRNVQLVIHLDFPWDADQIRQRHAQIEPHPTYRPCHAYLLISYGTVEHWLARLRGAHELFVGSDLREGQSVVLLDEPGRVKFFDHVLVMLEQVKEPPMVISGR